MVVRESWSNTTEQLGHSSKNMSATNVINAAANQTALQIINGFMGAGNALPTVEINTEWNTLGGPAAIKLNLTNTLSNFSLSRLIDLAVNGISKFSVDVNGSLFLGGNISTPGTITAQGYSALGTITVGTGFDFNFAQRSRIQSPVDGQLRFRDNLNRNPSAILFASSVVPKATSYSVQVLDSSSYFTNYGAADLVSFLLPTPAPGLHFSFVVQSNQPIKVIAGASSVIHLGPGVTELGGNISAVDVGSVIHLVALSSTDWFVDSSVGVWVLG
jgi:hypothetical protein